MTASTNGEVTKEDRDKLMSRAYGQAQKDLREAHQDEFNDYYQKRCAEHGIEWSPKPSKADAALNTILELLADNPTLSEKLAAKLAEQVGTVG